MKSTIIASVLSFFVLTASQKTSIQKSGTKKISNHKLTVNEYQSKLLKYNFSELFTHTDNSQVFGFIGDNFQRIRIKLISVKKDSVDAHVYHVYGKSMVKNIVDEFTGTLRIVSVPKLGQSEYGDNEKKYGVKGASELFGVYRFSENKLQAHSGIFEGKFRSNFYIGKHNQVYYDDIQLEADGYSNNEFAGQWVSHDKKIVKKCNWGDFRIPDSRGLDGGAGEFIPNDKYLHNGWETVRQQWSQDKAIAAKAQRVENAKWWL